MDTMEHQAAFTDASSAMNSALQQVTRACGNPKTWPEILLCACITG